MSILIDYILTLYPQPEFTNTDVYEKLQKCLSSYVNHQILFENAKKIILSLGLPVEPLEKLRNILSIESSQHSPNNSTSKEANNTNSISSQNNSTLSDPNPHSDNNALSSNEKSQESDIHEKSQDSESDSKSNQANNDQTQINDSNELSSTKKRSHCWTTYEDEKLLAAIHRFGVDNWSSIARFVGNSRTRSQCSQRWFRGLDPRLSKNQWTREEESMLIQLVSTYGDRSWTRVASKLGNRSDVQCRYHYKQIHKEFQSQTSAAAHFLHSQNTCIQNLFQPQQLQNQPRQMQKMC